MKKILFILVILFLFPFVSADTIVPGQVSMSYCASLENINEFPEYTFFTIQSGPMPEPGIQILNKDECIRFGYKFNSAEIYAIEKSNFNEEDINFDNIWNSLNETQKQDMIISYSENYYGYDINFIEEALSKQDEYLQFRLALYIYTQHNEDVIPLQADFNRRVYRMFWNPVKEVKESFEIKESSQSNLYLEKQVSRNYSILTILIYLVAIAALITLVFLIIKRRK